MGFWDRVLILTPDECWPWLGPLNSDGYGHDYPHRTAWIETNGSIPPGLCILHHCDNRQCCNPHHLFCGTHADNVKDKVSKGRQLSGEDSPVSILTVDEVKEIRAVYNPGVVTQEELALRFGVSQTTISSVVRGCDWKTVGGVIELGDTRAKARKLVAMVDLRKDLNSHDQNYMLTFSPS